jgi:hypothetical protein
MACAIGGAFGEAIGGAFGEAIGGAVAFAYEHAGVLGGGDQGATFTVWPGQTLSVTAPIHQRRGEVCLPRAFS